MKLKHGVDDDGNGYVDDYNGWNPLQNNDNYGTGAHGTNCLGMIGAREQWSQCSWCKLGCQIDGCWGL